MFLFCLIVFSSNVDNIWVSEKYKQYIKKITFRIYFFFFVSVTLSDVEINLLITTEIIHNVYIYYIDLDLYDNDIPVHCLHNYNFDWIYCGKKPVYIIDF